MRHPQQMLHASRPVLAIDIHRRLEFLDAKRIALGIQDTRDYEVRRPRAMHQDALEALQYASALPVHAAMR